MIQSIYQSSSNAMHGYSKRDSYKKYTHPLIFFGLIKFSFFLRPQREVFGCSQFSCEDSCKHVLRLSSFLQVNFPFLYHTFTFQSCFRCLSLCFSLLFVRREFGKLLSLEFAIYMLLVWLTFCKHCRCK